MTDQTVVPLNMEVPPSQPAPDVLPEIISAPQEVTEPADEFVAPEHEAYFVAPEDVEDPNLVALRSALEAPGHAVGDVVDGRMFHGNCGLFQCGVDGLGRIWRIESFGDNDVKLVLAGRLAT